MRDGDDSGRGFEGRVFGHGDPLERELALIDPFHGGEPDPLELARLAPMRPERPMLRLPISCWMRRGRHFRELDRKRPHQLLGYACLF